MYRVARIGPGDLDRVAQLLEDSPFKPYRFLRHSGRRELSTFWLATLEEQSQSGIVAVCFLDGRIVGLASLAELDWESRVLATRIFGITQLVTRPDGSAARDVIDLLLEHVLAAAVDQRGDAVHCKRFTDDVIACQALERRGFLLVDTQLVYGISVAAAAPGSPDGNCTADGCRIRMAEPGDVEALAEVARASFKNHFGRFHSDHQLPPGSAERIYEEWIRSSFAGYADWVVVAEVEGRLAACSVWRRPSAREARLSTRPGHYSLGAVHPDFQRRGLFTEVTRRGVPLFEGCADYVVGPTHVNNYGVQRSYARMGWQIVDANHAFHKWLR